MKYEGKQIKEIEISNDRVVIDLNDGTRVISTINSKELLTAEFPCFDEYLNELKKSKEFDRFLDNSKRYVLS